MRTGVPPAAGVFVRLGAAFLLWSASFALLYALLSFGCAFGWERMPVGPFTLQRVVLVGAWVLCLAASALLVLLAVRARSDEPGGKGFVRVTSLALGISAFAVTAANFAPVTLLSTCL